MIWAEVTRPEFSVINKTFPDRFNLSEWWKMEANQKMTQFVCLVCHKNRLNLHKSWQIACIIISALFKKQTILNLLFDSFTEFANKNAQL